ncbi:MAG: inositol monophosphatase family protein [SAR324 cluster bacterium]|uniref:Inositol monophosphatase family protein n=1 Tax=SAR324 cluster bacterium TaxID=2024889 RepID=A0A7X9IJB8_9DELT|nr:inositol monophosphatase family protein [SAR324 cluster bacterium]
MTALSKSDFRDIKHFMQVLASESSNLISRYFKKNLRIEAKADNTPVTIADRLTEERLRSIIEKEFPSHGIIGEEFGAKNEDAEFTWVLDPIDGTKSFISGAFDFGTLVALLENGQPILGMINQPILKELMIGDGETTTLNEEVVHVRECKGLSEATLVTWDLHKVGDYQDAGGFNELVKQVMSARTWGNCYGYALLASGFVDISLDPIMSPWDIMALIPIVRGAGGVITDYYGADPVKAKSIVAASPNLHSKVISILGKGDS